MSRRRSKFTSNSSKYNCSLTILLRAVSLLIGMSSLLPTIIGFIWFYLGSLPGSLEVTGPIVNMDKVTGRCPTSGLSFTAVYGSYVPFEEEYCFDQKAHIGISQIMIILYNPQNPIFNPQVIQRTRSVLYHNAGYAIAGLAFTLLSALPIKFPP